MVVWLFLPASLGLVWSFLYNDNWSEKILALAFFLMSLEQAKMAKVDLENIRIVKETSQELERINNFFAVTILTIILELLGFYLASFFLYWGAIVVLISLMFFNFFAKIQLNSTEEIMIESWQIYQRFPILLADGLGLILVTLGRVDFYPLLISSILLGIVIIYGIIKYRIVFTFDR